VKVGQERCITAVMECCKFAEDNGITLCIENHGGITSTADGVLAIVKGVDSKALAVNIDSSNFRVTEPYAEVAKIAPYGFVCQLKSELYKPENKKEPMDFERFLKVLKDANYSGPVSLEHEAKEDPKEFVPKHIASIREAIKKVYG
jgi:sugar phosphate isomerase/epimerase